jgi:hypothetical protein
VDAYRNVFWIGSTAFVSMLGSAMIIDAALLLLIVENTDYVSG